MSTGKRITITAVTIAALAVAATISTGASSGCSVEDASGAICRNGAMKRSNSTPG